MRNELVVGVVVRGALVVRFGAGLGVVRVGFGVGFGVGLLVSADGLGDSTGDVVAAEGETEGSSSACRADAEAAAPATGFLSSELPMAARPPPQQQSRSTPRKPPAIF
ncbi:hypothetical protein ACWEDF_07030 [Micromonospora chersina]